MSDSIADLSEAVQRFADERDWGRFHSPKNLASALIVEAAELLEHFQWLTESQSRSLPPARHEAVADEAADVLIYLVQFANSANIDLLAAARRKLRINATRFPIEGTPAFPIEGTPAFPVEGTATFPEEQRPEAGRHDRTGNTDAGSQDQARPAPARRGDAGEV